jgi:hypothetical protein
VDTVLGWYEARPGISGKSLEKTTYAPSEAPTKKNGIPQRMARGKIMNVLNKPFSMRQMLETAREVLDRDSRE